MQKWSKKRKPTNFTMVPEVPILLFSLLLLFIWKEKKISQRTQLQVVVNIVKRRWRFHVRTSKMKSKARTGEDCSVATLEKTHVSIMKKQSFLIMKKLKILGRSYVKICKWKKCNAYSDQSQCILKTPH